MVALMLVSLCSARAQLPQARLTALFPPGAQRGTTVEVTITGGTDLDEVDQLVFSHPGLKAVQKLDANGNPVNNTFIVSADVTVPQGLFDARVRGLFGISNPRAFRVDTLTEIAETEPNNSAEQATAITLNSIVNARANGGTDVDFFRLHAEAGQTVVVRSEAAILDSTMQPVVQVFDPQGHRVAESRRKFSQDAAMVFTATSAGDYMIKVADVVYGGGNEYVYRLSVDTRPLVDAVIPAVVSASQPTNVQLVGRHLPDGQPSTFQIGNETLRQTGFTLKPDADAELTTGIASFAASANAVYTNAVDGNLLTISHSDHPVVIEDPSVTVQTVNVPSVIDGRFEVIGDEDDYRFTASKGEVVVVEVYADRNGSIADPLLMVERVVTAADGAETFSRLGTEDDNKQNPGGADLPTLSSDPVFQLTASEDGTYRVRLRDRYSDSRGDARLSYSLSIRRPAPDFSLIVFDAFPSTDGKAPATSGAVSLRKGGTYSLTVYAYRHDGHNEPIRITAENLPDGISCPDALIGAGATSAALVFSASPDVEEMVQSIRITGTAGAEAQQKSHAARVATLIHDAINGMPRTARLSDSLVVGVMKDEQPFSIDIKPMIADLSQDQQLLIPVKLQRRAGFDRKVDISVLGVPANVDAPAIAIEPNQDSGIVRLFFKENAPVSTSSIVLSGTASVPYRRNPWQAERAGKTVQEAEAVLAQKQQAATGCNTALETAQKTVAVAGEQVTALMKEAADYAAMQQQLRDQFTKALGEYKASIEQLKVAQQKLAGVQAAEDSTAEQFDAALKSSQEAAAVLEAAAAQVKAITEKSTEISVALATAKQNEATKVAEKVVAEAKLADLKKAAEVAQAAVVTATKVVEQAQAQKKAADDAFKKADDAAKPKDATTRVVSVPVVVTLHPAPGKLTVAVQNGGAIKKGGTVEVKVTLTRKNNFTGAMTATLMLPPDTVGLASNTVEIPADKTEANLTITAAADAAAADIANAVIRATGEFNGRAASIDIPVQLKVTE